MLRLQKCSFIHLNQHNSHKITQMVSIGLSFFCCLERWTILPPEVSWTNTFFLPTGAGLQNPDPAATWRPARPSQVKKKQQQQQHQSCRRPPAVQEELLRLFALMLWLPLQDALLLAAKAPVAWLWARRPTGKHHISHLRSPSAHQAPPPLSRRVRGGKINKYIFSVFAV